jgi:hypothetical protein
LYKIKIHDKTKSGHVTPVRLGEGVRAPAPSKSALAVKLWDKWKTNYAAHMCHFWSPPDKIYERGHNNMNLRGFKSAEIEIGSQNPEIHLRSSVLISESEMKFEI